MAGWKILLVEGTDDEHVLKHICGNRGIAHLDPNVAQVDVLVSWLNRLFFPPP
jgi:hypothetical protein